MPTSKLALPYIVASQSQKEVTHAEALDILDAMHGRSTMATTGGTIALTEEEAQTGLLELTGTLASNVTIQYPSTLDGKIAIYNNTVAGDFLVRVQYGAVGSLNTIPTGGVGLLWQQGFTNLGNLGLRDASVYATAVQSGALVRRVIGPAVTKPLSTGWNARGTALSTNRNDLNGYFIQKAATAGENVCAVCRAVPSTPYTITARLTADIFNVATMRAGLCWYDGTKFICWGWIQTGGIMASSYNTATSKNADYGFVSSFSTPNAFFRLTDNGTNHIIAISYNGIDFTTVDTRSRTSHMAGGPTEVGLFVNPNNASWAAGLTCWSWVES